MTLLDMLEMENMLWIIGVVTLLNFIILAGTVWVFLHTIKVLNEEGCECEDDDYFEKWETHDEL